jgi:hypothetical protein
MPSGSFLCQQRFQKGFLAAERDGGGDVNPCRLEISGGGDFSNSVLPFSFGYWANKRRDETKRNSTRSPRRGGVGYPNRRVFARNCCITRS